MKIGIISDTHDNIENTREVIRQLQDKGCECLIICGDFCAPFMMKEFAAFNGKVHCCFGNTDDRFLSPKFAIENGIDFHGDHGEIEVDGKKIAFTHLPIYAKGLAVSGNFDLVCYGHTHVANKEKIGKTWFVNPGNVKGMKTAASYAVYNTESDEIEIAEM